VKKILFSIAAAVISFLIFGASFSVSAEGLPYDSYLYVDGKVKASPAMLTVGSVINGIDAGSGSWNSPQDICVANDLIYISDKDNNRIVVLSLDYKVVRIITTVYDNGNESLLSSPMGLAADKDYLYVADSGNARVLMLDAQNNVVLKLEKPDNALFDQNRVFQPQKVLRDKNGYFYVLSFGTYEGALLYNPDGTFLSFFGANRVTVTLSLLIEKSWQKILNKTQLSKVAKNIPQEYSSFDMDVNGFIFTCANTSTESVAQIKKLNPNGSNVWSSNINYGDNVSEWSGGTLVVSRFTDISTDDMGLVTAVDAQRGHIFQYSAQDGRILSVTANNGIQQGTFGNLAAVDCYGGNVYVLDSMKGNLTVFNPTEYGILVRNALNLFNDGQYDASYDTWKEVLKKNGNMQIAYSGIGKALVGKGEYTDAMKYFKLANDADGYSTAFEAERKIFLRENFFWILPTAVILILLFLITGAIERKRKVDYATKRYNKWKYPFYIMMHPSNGFNDLHWTKRGSFTVASVIISLWLLSSVIKKQLSAFMFNANYSSKVDMNVWTQLLAMISLVLVFVVINWAVCTLFEGKGKIKDIYIYASYSILPVVVSNFLCLGLSYVLSLGESDLINILRVVFFLWAAILLLRGLSILHEYSIKQVILSIIATVFGMAIVIFLLLLVVSLFNKVASFIVSIINEIVLHSQQ